MPNRIIYGVISESDSDEFEKKVQQDLDDGWKLHGELKVTVTFDSDGATIYHHYHQAVTLLVDENGETVEEDAK